jgi:hypothetical protein
MLHRRLIVIAASSPPRSPAHVASRARPGRCSTPSLRGCREAPSESGPAPVGPDSALGTPPPPPNPGALLRESSRSRPDHVPITPRSLRAVGLDVYCSLGMLLPQPRPELHGDPTARDVSSRRAAPDQGSSARVCLSRSCCSLGYCSLGMPLLQPVAAPSIERYEDPTARDATACRAAPDQGSSGHV